MRRSTRQSSKPVIIDLRRTDIGFEVFDEKDIYQSVIPKPTVPRPEKPLSYPKSLSSKIPAMEKEAASPSSSMQAAEGLQRSRTMGKLPAVPPKVTIQNGATMPERSPVPTRPGDFAIKKELYAFSNLSMPSIRMGTMGESAAAAPPSDLFSSSQFERPTGPAFSHGVQPSGPAYHRPVERPQKNFPVAIPSVAQWFQMEKIHQIEKDYMPEFFVGKSTKTPEVYKRYRNFMINQYRQNPSNYLNATTCRKSLAGDACSIMRLHAFLEHWGLINFYIDPSGYPKNLFLNRANYTAERLLEFQNRDLKMDLIEQAVRNNLSSADSDLLIDEIRAMEKQGRPLCDFCGLGCGSIWYMHKISDQKNGLPEFGLEDKGLENGARKGSNERRLIFCIQCYHNKNFPGLLTENDFEKVNLLSHLGSETTIAEAIGSWSQEDSFKLVDLVQKHGDNWAEIQKSFPHRTKDDLVLHYLRMPIEKITSINILEMGEFRGHEDAPDDRIADLTPTVFGDYSNPILQHVAVFRSLLVKHKEQKKLKKKKATMAAKAEERKATKLEERSDLEITKVSDAPKEEEPSNTGEQMVTEPKIEGGETSQGEKELEIGKEDEMEEEKESPNGPDKTAQELSKHVANRLVELQIHKLDGKVEFLDEYERIIQHERKQYEVLQQSLISERVEVARKRAEVLKQHAPPPQQVYPEQTLDTGYFDFNPHGGAFGADDMLDLGMDKIEGFPKDTF